MDTQLATFVGPPRTARPWLERASGTLLIGLGVRLALGTPLGIAAVMAHHCAR